MVVAAAVYTAYFATSLRHTLPPAGGLGILAVLLVGACLSDHVASRRRARSSVPRFGLPGPWASCYESAVVLASFACAIWLGADWQWAALLYIGITLLVGPLLLGAAQGVLASSRRSRSRSDEEPSTAS